VDDQHPAATPGGAHHGARYNEGIARTDPTGPPAERSVEPAVCVYCASSRLARPEYRAAARRLGEVLPGQGVGIVYGGGAVGSMGALADGALSHGGRVIGILPRFMAELEWGHK